MGNFTLPKGQQMVQGFPIGRLAALENKLNSGAYWLNGSAQTTNTLTVSTTQPTNPSINDLWVDIT